MECNSVGQIYVPWNVFLVFNNIRLDPAYNGSNIPKMLLRLGICPNHAGSSQHSRDTMIGVGMRRGGKQGKEAEGKKKRGKRKE